MRIDGELLNVMAPAIGERQPPSSIGGTGAARAEHGSFADTLGQAVSKLDELQVDADAEARKVAVGQGNLHEMAIALEKADIGMRLAMKVRNKVVDAYNEIMRMSL
jgi:flagellar hook-basal body complex protein FliE